MCSAQGTRARVVSSANLSLPQAALTAWNLHPRMRRIQKCFICSPFYRICGPVALPGTEPQPRQIQLSICFCKCSSSLPAFKSLSSFAYSEIWALTGSGRASPQRLRDTVVSQVEASPGSILRFLRLPLAPTGPSVQSRARGLRPICGKAAADVRRPQIFSGHPGSGRHMFAG